MGSVIFFKPAFLKRETSMTYLNRKVYSSSVYNGNVYNGNVCTREIYTNTTHFIRRLFISLIAVLPFIFSAFSSQTQAEENLNNHNIQQPNIKRATDFTLKQYQGPNTRLLDQRGKVVLLNFWATWCGPCRQEMPMLMALQAKFEVSDFIIFGINIDTNHREVEKYLHDIKVNYPILYDKEQTVSKQYAVKEMPSSFIIDRDGNIQFEHIGYQPDYDDLYLQEIKKLLQL